MFVCGVLVHRICLSVYSFWKVSSFTDRTKAVSVTSLNLEVCAGEWHEGWGRLICLLRQKCLCSCLPCIHGWASAWLSLTDSYSNISLMAFQFDQSVRNPETSSWSKSIGKCPILGIPAAIPAAGSSLQRKTAKIYTGTKPWQAICANYASASFKDNCFILKPRSVDLSFTITQLWSAQNRWCHVVCSRPFLCTSLIRIHVCWFVGSWLFFVPDKLQWLKCSGLLLFPW